MRISSSSPFPRGSSGAREPARETVGASASHGEGGSRAFEFTEQEEMADPGHVANIVATYQAMGFGTALDDFGAGHAGLGLLARFQPDMLKLDMELIRGIDASLPRRVIVDGVVRMCDALGLTLIAEGVETQAELEALRALGIRYVQGYLIARPGFEALPLPAQAANVAPLRRTV